MSNVLINGIKSHPTMGAWIEIYVAHTIVDVVHIVAPHDGCVD